MIVKILLYEYSNHIPNQCGTSLQYVQVKTERGKVGIHLTTTMVQTQVTVAVCAFHPATIT